MSSASHVTEREAQMIVYLALEDDTIVSVSDLARRSGRSRAAVRKALRMGDLEPADLFCERRIRLLGKVESAADLALRRVMEGLQSSQPVSVRDAAVAFGILTDKAAQLQTQISSRVHNSKYLAKEAHEDQTVRAVRAELTYVPSPDDESLAPDKKALDS